MKYPTAPNPFLEAAKKFKESKKQTAPEVSIIPVTT